MKTKMTPEQAVDLILGEGRAADGEHVAYDHCIRCAKYDSLYGHLNNETGVRVGGMVYTYTPIKADLTHFFVYLFIHVLGGSRMR